MFYESTLNLCDSGQVRTDTILLHHHEVGANSRSRSRSKSSLDEMQATARSLAGHAARQQLPSPPKLKITATRIVAMVAPVASVHTSSCLAPSVAPHAPHAPLPVVQSPFPLVSPNDESTAALVKRFLAASRKRAEELLRAGHVAMAAYLQWLRRAVNAAARAGKL